MISNETPRIPASEPGLLLRFKTPTRIHVVRKDGFQGKIYHRGEGFSEITWHEPAKPGRQRTTRARFDVAKKFLVEKLAEIAKGENWRSQLSAGDYSAYLRWIEIARKVPGVPVEVLLHEAVEARLSTKAGIVHKTCPDLVSEMLEQKRLEKKCGEKWLINLAAMLNRVAQFWPGPLHLVQPHDLNQFLRGLKGGLVYRHHHYAASIALFNYAKSVNAVPRESFGPDFWKLIEDPDRPPVKIKVWDPNHCERLLKHTRPNMIPFTACQAFAGVRTEEMRPADPRKVPLDWADFDWEQRTITINYETGKTGERIIPMSDNLIAWLKPYRKASGPICTVANTSVALHQAKGRAGLPQGKGESRNILRKSFGSYRLAQTNNIGQLAEEMGNSPAKIKSNYRKPKSAAAAKAWFGILPTSSGIAQGELKL
jgi:integrase